MTRRPARVLATLITGPTGFLVSGLLDVALALRLGALHLWRITMRSRWASGKGS